MALDYVPVPPNFIDLVKARGVEPNKPFDVIGVCVDLFAPIRCDNGQKDCKITFKLHDPTWPEGDGMEFVFFRKEFEQLPDIRDPGDVVILRNIKTYRHHGSIKGWSNSASTWVVLPYTEIANINSVQDLKEKARWLREDQNKHKEYPRGAKAALPNEAELKYAKCITEHEDPSRWPNPPPRTQREIADTIMSNGGIAPPPRGKFRTVDELQVPIGKKYIFADLLGEVRKVYSNDFLTELYLTDYTTNDQLYDYQSSDYQGGRDGDQFGYIKDNSTSWPGPWGKMTITIYCRDRQSDIANTNVKVGDFVYLRNIHITMDKNGSKLEGNCRGDPKDPEKHMMEVVKAKDERRSELLRRKRAYEQEVEAKGLRFFQHPDQAPNKRQRDEPTETHIEEPKSKRSKARNRKNKKAKLEAEQQAKEKGTTAAAQQERALLKPNTNIRINYHEGLSSKTIVDILDPDILNRTTAKGNTFHLPFQNCTYKAKVRVVDFFPDDIADFAAPRMVSQYEDLSDHEDLDDDCDIDLTQDRNHDNIKWEWRFFLLVEDARLQPGSRGRPTQMELLVADTDGDYLFNTEACNLRAKANENVLASLKEKLFHLWGDLQEKKEESRSTAEALSVKPSARPFECLIKEYGVPVRNSRDRSKNTVVYDRLFRLFGTVI